MTSIFSFDDYMEILKADLAENTAVRGYQARLAKAGAMHPSYFSRILNHSTHLTLDQAAGLCDFWELNHDETHYFLNLVHFARASSPHLKRILEAEIKTLKKKHDELGDKLPAEKMDIHKENIYYSTWLYCAVHVLLTIPQFRSESAISQKLGIPLKKVHNILKTLESLELVQKSRSGWEPKKSSIHLSNLSWMSAIHHSNWRAKMIDVVQFQGQDNLHYSGIHSLSVRDFAKLRERIKEFLIEVDQVVRPSKEEELCCLLIDWAKL